MTYHHFEILRREDGELWVLGQGAGGITYKARDTQLARLAALKVVTADAFKTPVAKERFVAEARTAASLHHPNIASIHYFGEQDGDCFYAMEFVDGCTLEELVQRDGALSAAAALDIAGQTAAALGVAHEADLIHRDIKPANILITESSPGNRSVKLIDFGLAAGANAAAGGKAVFGGTPLFASPEQLDEADVDARSDIYSLGATLFYALSGRPPYIGSISEIVTQHTLQPTPVDLIPSAPPEALAVVKRLMKKSPDQRPATGNQARAEIDAALRSLRPSNHATAVEWLNNNFATLAKGGAVYGGALYTVVKERGGEEITVLHLDQTGAGLAAADLYRFSVPRLQMLESQNICRVGQMVEVADGLLVVGNTPPPSTRLLSVMRVRRRLPVEEARLVLEPLAQALDEAGGQGLAIPKLGLRDIELRPPHDPKTDLRFWHGLVPCVDLLPLAEATRLDASTTIVGTSIVTAARAAGDEGHPPSFVLASLAYELLGGMTAPSVGRYVPIAELSEAQNKVLRLALSVTGASAFSAGDLLAGIFSRQPRANSTGGHGALFWAPADSVGREPVSAGHLDEHGGELPAFPSRSAQPVPASFAPAKPPISGREHSAPVPHAAPDTGPPPGRVSEDADGGFGGELFAVDLASKLMLMAAAAVGGALFGLTLGWNVAATAIGAAVLAGWLASSVRGERGTKSDAARDLASSANSSDAARFGIAALVALVLGGTALFAAQRWDEVGAFLKQRSGVRAAGPQTTRAAAAPGPSGQSIAASSVATASEVRSLPVESWDSGFKASDAMMLQRRGPLHTPGQEDAVKTAVSQDQSSEHAQTGQVNESAAVPRPVEVNVSPPSAFRPKAKLPAVNASTGSGSNTAKSAKRTLPRYIAVEVGPSANTPPGTTPVMIYDTKERRVLSTDVYHLQQKPQLGSVRNYGGVEAVFMKPQ